MVAEGRAEVIGFDAETADGRQVRLKGLLTRPDGTGPYSAMVMLPGSGGLFTPSCYGAVVEQFVNWGFVALVVAPTTARERSGNKLFQYSFVDLGKYAQGAASALAAEPLVDPARIGLWGHSRGGAAANDVASSAGGKQSAFRAAVAASPECPAKSPPTIPLLVLIGTEDTAVAVDWCINYAAQLKDVGGFEFLLIPNAGHIYWAPGTPKYNETAANLAERRLKAFLTKHSLAAP
jgi:dienelactone hydrolase